MPADPDRAAALTDVRKAYRLLWAYQRHVLDILHLVEDAFDDREFFYWDSSFSDLPPQRGTTPLDKWAWDFLPLSEVFVLFLPREARKRPPKAGEWLLEAWVLANDAQVDPEDGNEPDARKFDSPSEASSRLVLQAWQCREDVDLQWIRDVVKEIEGPDEDMENVVVAHEDPPISVLRRSWDLATLSSREDVQAAISEFQDLLRDRMGIS